MNEENGKPADEQQKATEHPIDKSIGTQIGTPSSVLDGIQDILNK